MAAEFSPKQISTIFKNLERIRVTLNLKHSEWAEVQGFTPLQYSRVYLKRDPDYSYHHLSNAASYCELLPEHIVCENSIDYKALLSRIKGDGLIIPEKYTVAAFSKRRTALAVLDHASHVVGIYPGTLALKELQVSLHALGYEDAGINIDFIVDLLSNLRNMGLPSNEIPQIGVRSVNLFKKTTLGRTLARYKTPRDVYEHMVVELVNHYESNCSYQLTELSDNHCTIEAIASEDVSELLKKKIIGSPETCLVRTGILKATPFYIGLPYASVNETQCVHSGDSVCKFEVDFSHADQLLRTTPPSSRLYCLQ